MSEPHESRTFRASAVVERSGSPAVMYGINATFHQNQANKYKNLEMDKDTIVNESSCYQYSIASL